MIRVLLDCRMMGWSGIGRYTTGLVQALAASEGLALVQVRDADHVADVARLDSRPGGTEIQVLRTSAHPFTLAGALEFGRIVRRVKPDITHSLHFPTPLPKYGPLVVTMHDVIPLLEAGVMPSAVRRVVYRRWNKRAVRVADRIVVPSAAAASDIVSVFPEALARLTVIPEAADAFSVVPPPAPAAFTGTGLSPYLLSIASSRPHKDMPTLIQAFSRLHGPEASGVRLLLAGQVAGDYVQRVHRELACEVAERVVFLGHVDDAELRALYSGAAAFVFPSRREGFGLPPLEAMASGAPVVYADAPSVVEVMGDAGLRYPAGDVEALADRLRRILRNPGLRDELADAGRERAALFTWSGAAAATVSVYREVLDGGAGWVSRTVANA